MPIKLTEKSFCTRLFVKESDKIKTKQMVQGIAIVLFLVLIAVAMAYGVGTDKNSDVNHDISVSSPDINSSNSANGEKTKSVGFEAVFAIAGLLAVAYLVLRRRD